MNKPAIPVLKRSKPSRFQLALMLVFMYLLVLPLNWLMNLTGRKARILSTIMYKQLGKGGPARAFANYTPAPCDVVVSTFAKSGTNWMLQIAHQIIFNGDAEFEHIHDVVAWPDVDPNIPHMPSISLQSDLVQQLSPAHLRVIKTHLSAAFVPYNEQAHYIVVLRDPKEVCVSSYYFVKASVGPLMPSPDDWFELFLTEHFPMNFGSTWAEHVDSYWRLRDHANVLILFYSEMKQDLAATIERVADFLGVTLSEAAFAKVLELSSFAYMKTIDEKFLHLPKDALPWGEMKMMRQGKSGNSQELLSQEQQARIDKHMQAELQRLGSDFPYAACFQH